MSVKIELVFDNVEAAVVALGKIAGLPAAAAVTQQPPEKAPRQPRADRGQPRGPHKKEEPNAAGASAGANAANAGNSTAVTTDPSKTPVQGANSTSTTTAAPGAGTATSGAASTTAPAATGTLADLTGSATAVVPTPDDVQKAVEALFNAKGFEDCAAVLSRFGVKRGKDLLPESRAEFIAKAGKVAAGTEKP